MKKLPVVKFSICFFVCVSVFMSCATRHTSSLPDADKQYIRDLTNKVQDDWNRGEKESYVNRFSEDAFYMAPHMESIVGKSGIRTFANSFPELKLKYSLSEINGSADFAYVRATYMLTTSKDSLFDKGKFLSIWKKVSDNKWLLTHDMFSTDLPLVASK